MKLDRTASILSRPEAGSSLVYMAAVLATLLMVDRPGRRLPAAYIVKAQLSKAVDGAALGAARSLNSGNPRSGGDADLQGELPAGYLGTAPSPDPTAAANFFASDGQCRTGRQRRDRERHGHRADRRSCSVAQLQRPSR